MQTIIDIAIVLLCAASFGGLVYCAAVYAREAETRAALEAMQQHKQERNRLAFQLGTRDAERGISRLTLDMKPDELDHYEMGRAWHFAQKREAS